MESSLAMATKPPHRPPLSSLTLLLLLLLLLAHPFLSAATPSITTKAVPRLPGFAGTLPFSLETGYVELDDGVRLFYYFIESERDPAEDPVLLWLTGGPGCSALSGLVYEIGPFYFDFHGYTGGLPTLLYKPASWTKADSEFWKRKLNPPMRKPRAVKTVVHKKKAATSDIPESQDSEDDTEASHADAPEHTSKRQTRSSGSHELMNGLPNSPVSRKRPAEDSPSSGDSTATKLPPMKINPGGLAKQRKTGESETVPTAQEPEKTKPDIPVPPFECTKTGEETPVDDPQLHEPAGDDTAVPMIPPQPVLQTLKTPAAEGDTLTGAGYQTPSHVLTRHSGEVKEKSPERIDFEFPSLEKMSTDDLHAGYLNRLNTSHNMERKLVGLMKSKFEEALKASESECAAHQVARAVAEDKWRVAVVELEKTQAELTAYRKTAESEKTALIKRVDDAESRLKTVSDELQTLKNHISRMTSAIFGERSRQLSSDSEMKLKAVYSLAEQLYCGTLCTIKAMVTEKCIPKSMKGVIEMLSTLPKQLLELKRSAARQGAMAALSRCLAYAPELTTEEMADGFPAKKVDGSDFSETDYAKCMKGSRVLASSLANELDLSIYQAAYDAEKKRVQCPTFEARSLTPARRKQLFAPGLDTSDFFNQAQFEALTRCNWDVDNLQIQDDEEPTKDDEPGRCSFS